MHLIMPNNKSVQPYKEVDAQKVSMENFVLNLAKPGNYKIEKVEVRTMAQIFKNIEQNVIENNQKPKKDGYDPFKNFDLNEFQKYIESSHHYKDPIYVFKVNMVQVGWSRELKHHFGDFKFIYEEQKGMIKHFNKETEQKQPEEKKDTDAELQETFTNLHNWFNNVIIFFSDCANIKIPIKKINTKVGVQPIGSHEMEDGSFSDNYQRENVSYFWFAEWFPSVLALGIIGYNLIQFEKDHQKIIIEVCLIEICLLKSIL